MANEKRLIKVSDATRVYNGIALYMAENAYLNDTALDVLKMVANWLNDVPTVDAVEVVHGRWIEKEEKIWNLEKPIVTGWECSKCGEMYGHYTYNYCPNCGAKMDMEVDA